MYDFLHNNPDAEAHPVEYVNDPFVIVRNANVVWQRSAISASGRQVDFVRGAYASRPGGRSMIACHSTAAQGTISRIAPVLTGPVTTPPDDTPDRRHRLRLDLLERQIGR